MPRKRQVVPEASGIHVNLPRFGGADWVVYMGSFPKRYWSEWIVPGTLALD